MKRTRLTACLLAWALCFGLLPGTAFAVEPGARLPRLRNTIFNFVKGDALVSLQGEAESFPDSFDLRHVPTEDGGEVSYVTPVRLQNPYGTCWGFAAAAAAESSLLSSGLAQADGYDVNTLDLSEKHIAFFATSCVDDPQNPQYGEGWYFRNLPADADDSYSYRYNTGGMIIMATNVLSGGMGPVLEKRYDPATETFDEDPMLAFRGQRSEVAYWEAATQYDDNNQPVEDSYRSVPVWYSDMDDWYIPDDYRYMQDYVLKDSIVMPDPAGYYWDAEAEEYKYIYQPEAVEAIKQQLVDHHRAVCVSFCAESYLPGQDTGGKKYMSENWAHFTNDENENSNHSVTIVGYDDNYPASNFNSTTEYGNPAQPEGDGAFLIKNSWGSELNEFPANGYRHWGLLDGLDGVPYDKNAKAKPGNRATGYFWISYYDRTLNDPEAFVFEKATRENDSLYIDQFDYMNGLNFLGLEDSTELAMANVFTAKATSSLNEISVMTGAPGTTVYYAVYLLGEGYEDPQDGILIETGEKTFEYGGYHRFALNSPWVLAKGQQYSVVVEEVAEGFTFAFYNADYDSGDYPSFCKSVINEGESFFYAGGAWYDESFPEVQKWVTSPYAPNELTIDNFPIRAYLEPITYPDGEENPVFNGFLTIHNWQEFNPGTFTVTNGESKTLSAEFRGLGTGMPESWNPSYTWVAADESLLSVTTSTPKKGSAVITGLKPGVTELIVYAGDNDYDKTHPYPDNYGVRVLTIKIYPGPNDTYIYMPENVIVDDSPACVAHIAYAENASVTAYAARYDADGRFLGAETMELEPGQVSHFTVLYDGADSIRFFALDDSGVPVCESATSPD